MDKNKGYSVEVLGLKPRGGLPWVIREGVRHFSTAKEAADLIEKEAKA